MFLMHIFAAVGNCCAVELHALMCVQQEWFATSALHKHPAMRCACSCNLQKRKQARADI